MLLEPAKKMENIRFSGIRTVSDKVEALRGQGKDVCDLTIGRPNFDTPAHIKAAAERALREGKVHYTANSGILPLREAISAKLKDENALEYSPDEIIVTAGGAEALAVALLTFLNPGDEVLLPEPGFVSYSTLAHLSGGVPVPVSMKRDGTFSLRSCDLEAAITPNTRAIVYASPNNPTGTMATRADLEYVRDIAVKHNLLVVSDEVYEKIVFSPHRHQSIAALPGMRERVVTCNSLSKSYSMTGWRIGYLAAGAGLAGHMKKTHQGMVTCANSIAQWAALEAVAGSQQCVADMLAEYERRKALLIGRIGGMQPLRLLAPDGGIFAFLDVKGLRLTAAQACDFFLENGVAMVPGDVFGPSGEGYLRLSFGCSMEVLERAMERMENALRGI